MHKFIKIADKIDALNERVGRAASWLVLVVVLLGAWNALARYGGRFIGIDLASNAYLELQWYLFSAIFLLGLGYTLKRDEHVRVDVLHAAMKPRLIAKIDIVGTIVFLIPFCLFVLWSSWYPVYNSWKIMEQSPDPDGLARYPIKTLVPIAFILLLFQAISLLVRRSEQIRNSKLENRNSDDSSSIQNGKSGMRDGQFQTSNGEGSSSSANPKSAFQNPKSDAGGIP